MSRWKIEPLWDRFWDKVLVGDGCWEWTGAKTQAGYSNFRMPTGAVAAYRVAYEWFRGPIPAGLELDHTCRNRGCVNPAHVEPVTHEENMQRAVPWHYQLRKTHCPQNHAFEGANLYIDPHGKRACRICRNEAHRRYLKRQLGMAL